MKKLFIVALIIILLIGIYTFYIWLIPGLPAVDSISDQLQQPSVRIVDRYGRLLYEVIPMEGGRHVVLSIEDIPETMIWATLATEDKDFYSHPGIDLFGIMRAAWINLQGGETLAGGSTITQQVARTLLFSEQERFERSLRRKFREIILAWQLSGKFSKDEILALYLNHTYYGGLAYGIEAASQTFFGKSISELDLAECALLAGLPQAPASYNPFTNPDESKQRQEVVLGLMQDDGYISFEQREQAAREKLMFTEEPYPMQAPHFVMMVRTQLDHLFSSEEIISSGGLEIKTTLDLDWQRKADEAVKCQIEEMVKSPDGLGHNLNNAALVAIDPNSGGILALVGSPDYFDPDHSGAINMAISPRQPGSALKPIVYSIALDPEDSGGGWTAATMLLDVDTSFITNDAKAYRPQNYDLKEHGPVLLRDALASSLNIPAVITLEHVGLDRLFLLASKLGISTLGDPRDYDLSLALGGGEILLLELTSAYGAFANGGYLVEPIMIIDVRDSAGNLLYEQANVQSKRVLDERVAWLISDILSDNTARIMGFGENSVLRLNRPAAVKTGTTSNFHDNWTIGYTPNLVVGVWAGNSNYEPMREVDGLTGAAPIWHQFIRSVLGESPKIEFPQPYGLVKVEVCALSGLLPTKDCPYRRLEWFIEGTQPTEYDKFYRRVSIDSRTGKQADENTPNEYLEEQIMLDLPLQARAWAHRKGLILFSDLSIGETQEIVQEDHKPELSIIHPAPFSVYRVSNRLNEDSQRILVEAVSSLDLVSIKFFVNGKIYAKVNNPPFQTWWILEEGEHDFWVEALLEGGESLTSSIVSVMVEPNEPSD